jgi:fimbrial chaperone protein
MVRLLALTIVLLMLQGPYVTAAQLSVSPVLIDLEAPVQASVLNLSNDGDTPITVQARVFGWNQEESEEKLQPTEAVVVSPPIVTLEPRQNYTMRVVRVSKEPVRGEESYRVLIDELPDPDKQQTNGVAVLVRQSIPVFISEPGTSPADLTWALRDLEGQLFLVGTNSGLTRLRLANLTLHDPDGTVLSLGDGLIGYVLAQSVMRWPIGQKTGEFGIFGGVTLSGQSQAGAINANVAAPD